jgi:hypothetical protein
MAVRTQHVAFGSTILATSPLTSEVTWPRNSLMTGAKSASPEPSSLSVFQKPLRVGLRK